MYRSIRNAFLGGLALGLVGILSGCAIDNSPSGKKLDTIVHEHDSGSDVSNPSNDSSLDGGVDEGYAKDVTFDEGGFEDLGNDSDSGSEELKAIACPDVQEEVGGPYRIDDANDEHDGWCLYTVRVHDAFRFDGCRSTGDIAEYFFMFIDDQGFGQSETERCYTQGDLGFARPGEYEGRLIVFTENREERDEDSVFFIAN